jgi:hypothetical protein
VTQITHFLRELARKIASWYNVQTFAKKRRWNWFRISALQTLQKRLPSVELVRNKNLASSRSLNS